MKCVICKKYDTDDVFKSLYFTPVTCNWCRRNHYPDFMNDNQYQRYWDAFSVKWRRENGK